MKIPKLSWWLVLIASVISPHVVRAQQERFDEKALRQKASGGDSQAEFELGLRYLGGEGIVMKPLFEVAEHLRSGALVLVLPDNPPTPVTLAILHAYQRMVPPKVRAFADALADEARDHIEAALADARPGKARKRRAVSGD